MEKDMKKDFKCIHCLTLVVGLKYELNFHFYGTNSSHFENGSHFEFENFQNELPG